MLGRIGLWRHLVAGVAVLGTAVLAGTGVIGRGDHGERFESKVVTVQPDGADRVRIREVVDEDFAGHTHHGYERIIPTDFGRPINIEASSPDANADVTVEAVETGDRIRIGDPDTTYSGQHRYVLSYTLPDARLSTGELALDIIGDPRKPEEFETGSVRSRGDRTGAREPHVQRGRARNFWRMHAGTRRPGVSGGGQPIEGRPGHHHRRHDHRIRPGRRTGGPTASEASIERPVGTRCRRPFLFGMLTVAGVYASARRRGSNEVFAGGAADAAYGSLPLPSGDVPPVG